MLVNNLIQEGMAPEYRQAGQGLRNKWDNKWIVATYGTETDLYPLSSLAQVFAATTQSNSRCCKCVETGHWKGDCPPPRPNDSTVPRPPNPSVPAVGKAGNHWERVEKSSMTTMASPLTP